MQICVASGRDRFFLSRRSDVTGLQGWTSASHRRRRSVRTFISRRRWKAMGLRSNGRSCRSRLGLPKNGANVRGKRPRRGTGRGTAETARVPFERRRCARAHRDCPGRSRPDRGASVDRRLAHHFRPAAQRRDGRRWHRPHGEGALAGRNASGCANLC